MNAMANQNALWSRRELLASGVAAWSAACSSGPETREFDLGETNLDELRRRIDAGEENSRSICEKYLARIDAVDQQGPAVNALLEINPEALEIADRIDREREESGVRGPLHGVPVLLKDNIDTGDQMQTSAGSLALVGSPADQDAYLTQRLREAGAVILGKTNLSEWANFRSSSSVSGWSGRGGLTRNPYALDHNACGSSSGSAVAVSANLAPLAVGTETNGSIICPASINGVVGIKPTLGLVSRSGVVPIAHNQDTAGPMARTVRDAAILLGAMVGADPRDPITAANRGLSDYTPFLDANGLQGARLGVARNYFGSREAVDGLIGQALEEMQRRGAELIDVEELPPNSAWGRDPYLVLLHEFKVGVNTYLQTRTGVEVGSLAEVIAFNEANRDREMPYFGQEILLDAEETTGLESAEYLRALEKCRRLSRQEGIDLVMEKHGLDAIVAPSTGPSWPTDLENGDPGSGGCSSPAARAGYPHVTIPAGLINGLPVGLSFFAGAFSEPKLLALAYSFEQATHHRRQPGLSPTAAR